MVMQSEEWGMTVGCGSTGKGAFIISMKRRKFVDYNQMFVLHSEGKERRAHICIRMIEILLLLRPRETIKSFFFTIQRNLHRLISKYYPRGMLLEVLLKDEYKVIKRGKRKYFSLIAKIGFYDINMIKKLKTRLT